MTVIGTRLPRQEDPRLLRGRGRFGDDFSAPGQLWARIVRSRSAHGQVRQLDVTEAVEGRGITAVVTARDLPGKLVIPVRLAIAGTDLSDFLQPVLAATPSATWASRSPSWSATTRTPAKTPPS